MSENFYMKRTFDDFSAMAEALRHWKIEIRQLEPREISDTLVQVKTGNLYIGQAQFSGITQQVGAIPPGRTFAFHTGEDSQLLWRKKDVPLNTLMIFPPGADLDVVTKGSQNDPHTISVPEELLLSRLQESERTVYEELVASQDLVAVSAAEMEELQKVFDKYLQSVDDDPDLVHVKSFQTCLEEELLSALIEALLSDESLPFVEVTKNRDQIWRKLEEYIETNKHRPIKVSELSQTAGVSERNLYRCFNKRFGISPKAYLNKLRLNGARLDLKRSSTDEVKITDVANDWGFWHMGQFAADYRQLFGELPSETLQKR
ncbi:MAG: helix-turn-helix domain-containing protein [Sulfurimonadaceae bacterium]